MQVEPGTGALPSVEFRWDADTDILTATVEGKATGKGMSGSVEIEGADGSWVILDVNSGRIASVEVAVWPDVRKVGDLKAPADASDGVITIPARVSQPGVASLEVDTRLVADADAAERTIHFRFGAARQVRAVRLAKDLVFDIDDANRIAGLWLLNVPPFPTD